MIVCFSYDMRQGKIGRNNKLGFEILQSIVFLYTGDIGHQYMSYVIELILVQCVP